MLPKQRPLALTASLLSCCLYSATPAPAATPSFTVLYGFNEQVNNGAGQTPSGLVIGSDAVLYGTTAAGGANAPPESCEFGCGTVLSLAPPSSPGGPWVDTVLRSFGGARVDGITPFGGVVIGSGGVLYGTTAAGTGPIRRVDLCFMFQISIHRIKDPPKKPEQPRRLVLFQLDEDRGHGGARQAVLVVLHRRGRALERSWVLGRSLGRCPGRPGRTRRAPRRRSSTRRSRLGWRRRTRARKKSSG
jgi:hypothetical protein